MSASGDSGRAGILVTRLPQNQLVRPQSERVDANESTRIFLIVPARYIHR